MPVSTTCEKCQRPLRANSSLAGKVVRCPQCGEEIRIPTESAVRSSESATPLPPRVTRGPDEPVDMPALRRHKYRPKRGSWIVAFRKKRLLTIRLSWWVTVLALVLVIAWAFDRVRNGVPNRKAGPPVEARQPG